MADDGSGRVQSVTIHRVHGGYGLLYRVLPNGHWRLREYDSKGDEEVRREPGPQTRTDQ